ncbi:hypothetical protein BZZ01_32780 (plasmid) [Nostocales cyanobacterium HT-58-2]|nr:hypothetical protein BZZ01_32780 [Nostocales cyanobacterium HT-58-2]
MLNVNLTQLGSWELTYFQKLQSPSGNTSIESVELPYLTDCHIFLVGATSLRAKPTWYRAGWLHQQINGVAVDDTVVFEGLERIPTTTVAATQRVIPLNSMQLVIFPHLTSAAQLRFEPVRWLRELTLGVWEYRGVQSDSTEELLQTVRTKLETIEFKIDQL